MNVQLSTASPAEVEADLLVIGVKGPASGYAAALEAGLGDFGKRLGAWLESRKFEAKAGTTQVVPGFGVSRAALVAIVSVGDLGKADLAAVAGKIGALARGEKATRVAVAVGALGAAQVTDLVELVAVGNYAYELGLPEAQRKPRIATVTLLGVTGAEAAIARGLARAKWQAVVRDLVNQPPGELYPDTLAAEARKLAALPHVTVEVWDQARCQAEGLVGICAVGQGSVRPPLLVKLTYDPPGAKDRVALVGKGVTFDSGGLSLKPSDAMVTMRCDMGGAATVIGAVGAAAELGLPIAIHAFTPAVENMNSGSSYKLGDVLRYKNGVTAEVLNTDAEGRLILADALILASEVPGVSRIVDLATLTGAVVIALGPDYTGVFTKDDGLAGELLGAGHLASEKLWRLPLDDAYNRLIKGSFAQIKNTGGREGGSITAALFLQHFVRKDARWAHLDIAGAAFADHAVEPYAKGGTGQPLRTLVTWLEALAH